MRSETNGVLNRVVQEGLDSAQVRLHDLEKGAHKVLKTVRSRSKATQAQVADLLEKIEPSELIESAHKAEKQWTKKASKLGTNLVRRFSTLQSDLLRLAGVASRTDVAAIAADIEKISRKIDRLVKGATKSPAPRVQKALKAPVGDA